MQLHVKLGAKNENILFETLFLDDEFAQFNMPTYKKRSVKFNRKSVLFVSVLCFFVTEY